MKTKVSTESQREVITCSHVTFLSVCLLGFCEGEREGVRGFPLVMKGDFDIFFQLELHSEVRTRWAACPGPQRKKAQLFDRCPSILTLPKTNMFIIIIKNYTTVDPKQLHKSHMKFWRQTQSTDTPDQWDKSSSLQNDKGLWTLPNLVGPTMFLVYDPFCSTIFMPF